MSSEKSNFHNDFETSTPIGIYGLSPSSDAIVKESTWHTLSPIGSPIGGHIPSNGNSNKSDTNKLSFDPKVAKESYLGYRSNSDIDSLTRSFERMNLSPTSGFHSSYQHIKTQVSSSGPNVPLMKHKSLPSQFLSSSFQETNTFVHNYGSYTSTSQYLQVPKQYEGTTMRRNSKTMWDDDSKGWYDQFGIEIEQPSSAPNNGSSFIERNYRKSSDSILYPIHNSDFETSGSKLQHFTSRSPSSSSHYSSSKSKHQFRSSVHSSPSKINHNFNLKHKSRIIAVQNANLFSIDTLYPLFETFGEIRSTTKNNNVYLISYYDVRHSQAAMASLNGKIVGSAVLELSFYFLKDFSNTDEVNQGTLVIFNLDPSISIAELTRIFSEYGEVREIRESPNRKHKFVEFYDVRDAELAMKKLNKTEIGGKKIKIEASKPGNNKSDPRDSRKNYPPVSTSAPSNLSPILARLNSENEESITYSKSKQNTPRKSFTQSHRGHDDDSFDTDQFEVDISKILSKEDTRTTLMIKNIPNKYNQDMLLEAINENYDGLYDFFYLPIDFKNKCNVGYAFINFKDPLSIPNFYKEFTNKRWKKFNSEKVCQINYARIQGKEAMVEHFKNSSLLFEDVKCQPLIFEDGEAEPLPISSNIIQQRTQKQT